MSYLFLGKAPDLISAAAVPYVCVLLIHFNIIIFLGWNSGWVKDCFGEQVLMKIGTI